MIRRSMSQRTIYFDLVDTADPRFDRPIESLLAVLLLFAPLALGTVQAWSEWVVILLATVMAGLLGAKLIARRDLGFVWSWTYAPIAVVLALAVFQAIPFSPGLVGRLAPSIYQTKISLLAKAGITSDRMALSLYPEATLQNVRVLAAISVVYIVSLNVVRRTEQVRWIVTAMTVIGSIVALVGLGHVLTGATQVYGLFGQSMGRWLTGPFINRNHFGQCMNLGLGAALAMLLMRAEEVPGLLKRWRRGEERIIPADLWLAAGAAALMGVAVFLSLSRGAMLSLLVSGVLATVVLSRQSQGERAWIILPLAWVVGIVVIYFGFDLIAARFAQVADNENASVSLRVTIVRDIMEAFKDAPILGHGMGSFETVYPMLDTSVSPTLAVHAENEYAQALFEGGVVELGMVLLFLGMAAWSYVVCIRSSPSPMAMPAVGLGVGLLAVVLQSATDFGQHLPGNALTTAVQMAMLANLASAARQKPGDAPQEVVGKPGTRVVACILAAIVLGWILFDGLQAARADRKWATVRTLQARLRDRGWQGSDNEYVQLLSAASDASRFRPQDVHYRYWLNFYRYQLISRERDPKTGQVLYDTQSLDWAKQIARELREGAQLCPTYGPNFSLAGQIVRNALNDPGGDELIRTGYALSRTDPVAAFEMAMLDARAGEWEQALSRFERAKNLSPAYLMEGANALAITFDRTDLALRLAGSNRDALRQLANQLSQTGKATAATTVRAQWVKEVRETAARPDAPAEALADAAQIALADHDSAAAVGYLDRAIALDISRPHWRLELARALESQGNLRRALEEAQAAARMRVEGAQELAIHLRARAATSPSTTGEGNR